MSTMVFRTLDEAVRAGFKLYDAFGPNHIVHKATDVGMVRALVSPRAETASRKLVTPHIPCMTDKRPYDHDREC